MRTTTLKECLNGAIRVAKEYDNEFLTPEHVLYGMIDDSSEFDDMLKVMGLDTNMIKEDLMIYFKNMNNGLVDRDEEDLGNSLGLQRAMRNIRRISPQNNSVLHCIVLLKLLADSGTQCIDYVFKHQGKDVGDIILALSEKYNSELDEVDKEVIQEDRKEVSRRYKEKDIKDINDSKPQDKEKKNSVGVSEIPFPIRQKLAKEISANYNCEVSPEDIQILGDIVDSELPGHLDAHIIVSDGKTETIGRITFPKYSSSLGMDGLEIMRDSAISNMTYGNGTDTDKESKDDVKSQFSSGVITLMEVKDPKKSRHFGRHAEINDCLDVLCRYNKHNVIVTGEPGVGKTAFIDGVMNRVNRMKQTDPRYTKVKEFTFLKFDITSAVSGSIYKGQLEEKVTSAFNKAIKAFKNPVIFIDEFQGIYASGKSGGDAIGIDGIIKKYTNSGQIRFIGALATDKYYKTVANDFEINRRFQVIELPEPSVDECYKILKGVRSVYAKYHKVNYSDESLLDSIKISSKYINNKFLPDKALEIIDEAGVLCKKMKKDTVTSEMIEIIISKRCGIPVKNISTSELEKVSELNKELNDVVFGQLDATKDLSKYIKINKVGLSEDNKPIGNFLFVGPTGVGKTELARALADKLDLKLIKLDMSEYSEKHTVSKLVGSPQGYVGYDDSEATLVSKVRKNPNCVLLLDEIEKAHPSVYNVLLQIMDDATLTDSHGMKADFRNSVIIMTSNSGASDASKDAIGFGINPTQKSDKMLTAVNEAFTPEFRGRLTGIIKFNSIDNEMSVQITKKFIQSIKNKLRDRKVGFEIEDSAVNYLIDSGYTTEKGARGIQEVVDSKLKVLISEFMIDNKVNDGGKLYVYYDEALKDLSCTLL